MTPVFITGIGTDVGKTLVSAIVALALDADYWKPVQAGTLDNTDSNFVKKMLRDGGRCFEETYRLTKPASPHLSAAEEDITISLEKISDQFQQMALAGDGKDYLVIEGAGGLLVPLNAAETVADLILKLEAKTILVSRNYLGSINHSLLTAEACANRNIDVLGWIFTDEFMGYEAEIGQRTNLPVLGKIPFLERLSRDLFLHYANEIREPLLAALK